MSAQTIPLDFSEQADWLQPVSDPGAAGESGSRSPIEAVPAHTGKKRKLHPLSGALISVGVVMGILLSQLGLSIAVSEGAYEESALKVELRDLTRVERVLSQNAAKLASPQNLAENAIELGMVQNSTPATLRLRDGKVLGQLTAGTTAVATNLIENAALDGLPLVDADGLLVSRGSEQAETPAVSSASTPVTWEGELPAPDTH